MSTERAVASILTAVEKLLPPPTGCRHCITATSENGLHLQLNIDGQFCQVVIDDGDLSMPPLQFADLVLNTVTRGGG